MKTMIFRRSILLIAFMFVAVTGRIGFAQDGGVHSLKFVPESAEMLCVIRPAVLMKTKWCQELIRVTDGKASELVGHFTQHVFKMSLADWDEIDEIVISARAQERYLDPDAFVILVIRTLGNHRERFEMTTHAGSLVEKVQGHELIQVPSGGFFGFTSAVIVDDKTMVWGMAPDHVKYAMDVDGDEYKASDWYDVWKGHASKAFSFGLSNGGFKNVDVPGALRESRVFGGGVDVGTSFRMEFAGRSNDVKSAEELKQNLEELTTLGREKLNGSILNDDESLLRSILKGIDSLRFNQRRNDVVLKADFRVAPSALAPLIESYMDGVTFKKQKARRDLLARGLQSYDYHPGPSLTPIIVREGKKHSWRIEILKFVGEVGMYAKYHFNEDWDSPHNKKLTARMPDVFRSFDADEDSNKSSWYLLYGKDAAYDLDGKRKLRDIKDRKSDTILAVEAKLGHHWAEPIDIPMDKKNIRKFGGFNRKGFHAIFADGNSHFLSSRLDRRILFGLMTANGGEKIEKSEWQSEK